MGPQVLKMLDQFIVGSAVCHCCALQVDYQVCLLLDLRLQLGEWLCTHSGQASVAFRCLESKGAVGQPLAIRCRDRKGLASALEKAGRQAGSSHALQC